MTYNVFGGMLNFALSIYPPVPAVLVPLPDRPHLWTMVNVQLNFS